MTLSDADRARITRDLADAQHRLDIAESRRRDARDERTRRLEDTEMQRLQRDITALQGMLPA